MEKINVDQLEHLRISVNVYLLLVEDKLGREVKPDEIEVALGVELGKFLNHFPKEFKFWRFGNMKEVDKKAALDELADCINFMNMLQGNMKYCSSILYGSIDKELNIYNYYKLILSEDTSFSFRMSLIINLGFKFGFTWEEIYEATLNKIAIINERLNNETER